MRKVYIVPPARKEFRRLNNLNTSIDKTKGEFIFVNKPSGITSHDVVNKIRKATNEKRVGHAGTLDPFASGLLIVGIGRQATKKLNQFLKKDKVYIGIIYLGAVSTTDDPEGELIKKDCEPPKVEEIKEVFTKFTGEVLQTPPQFSAVKTKGKKAYELARKGEKVKLKPRRVKIHHLKLKRYLFPKIHFEAKVSSGTYIRAIARDVGKQLDCGAFLESLTRTKIGNIDISQARELKNLETDLKTNRD